MRVLLHALILTLLCFSFMTAEVAAQALPSIGGASGLLQVPPDVRLERVTPARQSAPPLRQSNGPRRRGVSRAIVGGVVGAVGGFFAGAYLGAMIEGDGCSCDDPGLKGALIGAPIGTATGAVLGAKYLF